MVTNDDLHHRHPDRFQPTRPAPRLKLFLAFVLGPIAWVIALLVAAWLVNKTNAIQIGMLVAVGSFVFSFVVLGLIRLGRAREERRYLAGRR